MNAKSRTPRKSIIVYGPAGCGKTRNAEAMRKHFGLDGIVEGEKLFTRRHAFDHLILTQDRPMFARRALSFEDAMQLLQGPPGYPRADVFDKEGGAA